MQIKMCILYTELKRTTSIADDCNNSIAKHTEQQQFKPSTQIAKEILREFEGDVMRKGWDNEGGFKTN